MRFVFFKTPKVKKFSYQPLYYDPEKENLESRKRELDKRIQLGKSEPTESSEEFKSAISAFYSRKQASLKPKTSGMRMYIISLTASTVLYLITGSWTSFIFFVGVVAYDLVNSNRTN